MTTRFGRLQPAVFFALALVSLGSSLAGAQGPRTSTDAERIFGALAVKSGSVVGEIGAGDGELTVEAARAVGASGKVFSNELGSDRVQALEKAVRSSGLAQITVITGDPNKTNFPDACCDAIFMRNVYHHFADPVAMTKSIAASLKPGGRVAVVDFMPNRNRPEAAKPADRANNESHGVSAESVARELTEAGLDVVKNEPDDKRGFLVVGMKRQ